MARQQQGGAFKGKKYPTFFELIDEFPIGKPKNCAINRGFRLRYRTDALNDYFSRSDDKGEYFLSANGVNVNNRDIALWNGTATLTAYLPISATVGDVLHFASEVTDSHQFEPFRSEFYVDVGEAIEKESKSSGTGKKTSTQKDKEGTGSKTSLKLALPRVVEVESSGWDEHTFTGLSALKVRDDGEGGYDFYINVHNDHLLTEMKAKPQSTELLKARYEYGMVLVGLALLYQHQNGTKSEEVETTDQVNIYQKIREVSSAISSFLLPMIATLGDLRLE